MTLTGENRSTLRNACSSATVSTTNPGIEVGSTNRLSHGMAYTTKAVVIYI